MTLHDMSFYIHLGFVRRQGCGCNYGLKVLSAAFWLTLKLRDWALSIDFPFSGVSRDRGDIEDDWAIDGNDLYPKIPFQSNENHL